jgi:hypothetical protein
VKGSAVPDGQYLPAGHIPQSLDAAPFIISLKVLMGQGDYLAVSDFTGQK